MREISRISQKKDYLSHRGLHKILKELICQETIDYIIKN